jgi:hypothetical protein
LYLIKTTKKERDVKNYLLLHYGFEKPTPEIMEAWGKWFESIADKTVDRGHLPGGREISHAGTKDLPMANDSITGYSVVRAENLDDAEKIAQGCPIIASTRVYEIMETKKQ